MSSSGIHVSNLRRVFAPPGGPAVNALDSISFHITAGCFAAIVGKSGSGKTTLLNLLSGLDRPTAGTIAVDGELLHTRSERDLSRWRGQRVGVVFQFFQLLPTLTAIENVILPLELRGIGSSLNDRTARARRLLDEVGVLDQAHKLPHAMSGGQQQRVAIARALSTSPSLLLADEPTGNLDAANSASVIELLQSLSARGTTVIVVTHDDEIARRASYKVHLRDGRIV